MKSTMDTKQVLAQLVRAIHEHGIEAREVQELCGKLPLKACTACLDGDRLQLSDKDGKDLLSAYSDEDRELVRQVLAAKTKKLADGIKAWGRNLAVSMADAVSSSNLFPSETVIQPLSLGASAIEASAQLRQNVLGIVQDCCPRGKRLRKDWMELLIPILQTRWGWSPEKRIELDDALAHLRVIGINPNDRWAADVLFEDDPSAGATATCQVDVSKDTAGVTSAPQCSAVPEPPSDHSHTQEARRRLLEVIVGTGVAEPEACRIADELQQKREKGHRLSDNAGGWLIKHFGSLLASYTGSKSHDKVRSHLLAEYGVQLSRQSIGGYLKP